MYHLAGKLSDDARGLYVRLQNIHDAQSVELLQAIYREVYELGGCDEGHVTREPGVNFNPRPARLLHILLDDFEVEELAADGAALCLALPGSARFRMKAATLEMLELSAQAQLCLEEASGEHSLEVRFLAASAALDEIRHLHMSTIHFDQKREILKEMSGKFLDQFTVPEAATARVKLETAIKLQSRRL